MKKLKYYLPPTMTHNQETVLADVSARLSSYGWKLDFIKEWWQTVDENLNGFCPLEALCLDKFDLVHMSLDKTVRLYEKNLESIEDCQKKVNQILKSDL